jgi:hypothetical protein
LEKTLVTLEHDYKTLYDSFLKYQKEADKQIQAERAKGRVATILAWILGSLASIMGGLYLFERFLIK